MHEADPNAVLYDPGPQIRQEGKYVKLTIETIVPGGQTTHELVFIGPESLFEAQAVSGYIIIRMPAVPLAADELPPVAYPGGGKPLGRVPLPFTINVDKPEAKLLPPPPPLQVS